VARLDPPVFSRAPADPTWRQSHPNGLTERELQELSSSALAMWHAPRATGAAAAQSNIAQRPGGAFLATGHGRQ